MDSKSYRASVGAAVITRETAAQITSETLVELLDWMEFRTCVEVEAAGLAAQRRTEAHLFSMERSLRSFEQQAATGAPAGDHDRNFHYALAEATANARFTKFLGEHGARLIPPVAFGAALMASEERRQFLQGTLAEHCLIFEAVRSKDPDAAREAMRNHLKYTPAAFRNWLANGGSIDTVCLSRGGDADLVSAG